MQNVYYMGIQSYILAIMFLFTKEIPGQETTSSEGGARAECSYEKRSCDSDTLWWDIFLRHRTVSFKSLVQDILVRDPCQTLLKQGFRPFKSSYHLGLPHEMHFCPRVHRALGEKHRFETRPTALRFASTVEALFDSLELSIGVEAMGPY